MVCLGNICRSPIAEGVMQHKIQEAGLDWTVASAGTESYHVGSQPHIHSIEICEANGIDIKHQRACRFTAADFDTYDKIYAMASDVYNEILRIAGTKARPEKLELFLNELHPGMNESVPDPWYGNKHGYYGVYEMINATCSKIIERYR